MVVVDANDASGLSHADASRISPVLHPAVGNLIEGLRKRDDLIVEVIYGKRNIAAGERRTEQNIRYLPVPYRTLPIRGIGSAFFCRTAALLRHLAHSRPDLVHGQGTERESGLVAALCGRPSVVTLHGNFRELAKTLGAGPFSNFGLCAMMERFILPRVSVVHCISRHARLSVQDLARDTRIIPNAVADEFFAITPRPSDSPQIVCVSGITEWKDPLTLINAGDLLRQEFPETEIHFHGACYESHPYGRTFLSAISSRPWCVFHGFTPVTALADAFASATCAVLPSRQENFGLALAEAMAAGVAAIGTDAGGIPEVITDGETGRIFPIGDSTGLARILIDLHQKPGTLSRLAEAGRRDACQRFSITAVADAHARMYHEILTSA